MFKIENVTIKIDDNVIVENLNLALHKKDKIAIIGEEGNGKSTILKALVGICDYATVSGTISGSERVGYLPQLIEKFEKDVYSYLFSSEEEYYDKISKLYDVLTELGLEDDILNKKISILSGGEKVKVGLLKILLDAPEILFLDEPTNDLDLETLNWLESFILKSDLPILYVSHDETLLSHTANGILHLERLEKKTKSKCTFKRMTYLEYIRERNSIIENQKNTSNSMQRSFEIRERKLKEVMNKVDVAQRNISRQDPHGARLLKKKMHSLKSQEKRLYETELVEQPEVEEAIEFFFEDVEIPKNKLVLDLHLEKLEVDNRTLAENIELYIKGNEHVVIIGKNGVGKTTLLKRIHEELKNHSDFKVGYMSQDYDDILGNYDKVVDFISEERNKEEIKKARVFLACMKMTQDEIDGKVANLSNGTKAKLILMKYVLDGVEVLLLDEPTRNISPLSNPVFRRALKTFNGAIISISHDRKYIDEVGEKIYELTRNGLVRKR